MTADRTDNDRNRTREERARQWAEQRKQRRTA